MEQIVKIVYILVEKRFNKMSFLKWMFLFSGRDTRPALNKQ